jgi:hypothetical protein
VYARRVQSSCLQRIAPPISLNQFVRVAGTPTNRMAGHVMRLAASLSGQNPARRCKRQSGVQSNSPCALHRKGIHPVVLIASISGSISFGPTSTYTGPWAMDTPPLARGVITRPDLSLRPEMYVRREDRTPCVISAALPSCRLGFSIAAEDGMVGVISVKLPPCRLACLIGLIASRSTGCQPCSILRRSARVSGESGLVCNPPSRRDRRDRSQAVGRPPMRP